MQELVNETLTTALEDFVGDALDNSGKTYGRNFKRDYEEDDFLIAKKSLQSALGNYRRYAKPVEVWTKEQKDMLKRIDELLARPITPAE